MLTFDDIFDAFLFVSGGDPFSTRAVLHRGTGEILYASDDADLDEIGDIDCIGDEYVAIPSKHDLDLGQRLVFRFVDEHLPQQYDAVRGIFSRRGAYSRFKDLLDRCGQLEAWYAFEQAAQEEALREWCNDNGITLA